MPALELAQGDDGKATDQQGALKAPARQAAGTLLLIAPRARHLSGPLAPAPRGWEG